MCDLSCESWYYSGLTPAAALYLPLHNHAVKHPFGGGERFGAYADGIFPSPPRADHYEKLERLERIELSSYPWKGSALPLSYSGFETGIPCRI